MISEPTPRSQDLFLAELLDCIRRRRKSLKHQTRSFTVERLVEMGSGDPVERIEIEARLGAKTVVRLFAWQSRQIWIDARQPGAGGGWAWAFTDEGRLTGENDARSLLAAFEATLAMSFGMTAASADGFSSIWAALLAKGPRQIVDRPA